MVKRYKKEWEVEYEGKTILIDNWWNLLLQTGANLYLDEKLLDESKKGTNNPNMPFLSAYDVDDKIKSIEVFVCAIANVKISVYVNDIQIYSDKLNFVEKIYKALSPKRKRAL